MRRAHIFSLVGLAVVTGCTMPQSTEDDQPSPASSSVASPSAPAISVSRSSSLEKKPSTPQPNLYDTFLFFPAKYPDGSWDVTTPAHEDVSFEASDGTKLHGWFCAGDTPRAVVLYCHGNGGNLTYDVMLLHRLQRDLHVSVLAFDYRGYGRSNGTPCVAGALDDSRAARKWLARRAGIGESEVVLMGRSLGGAMVVQLASEIPARGLIIESTFASLKETAGHHFPRLAWMVPADELNSAARLSTYQGPLLQSHGDADGTIPFAQGEKLYHAAKGPKEFFRIAGADHNDPQPDKYYHRLDQFLAGLPTK